MPIRRSALLAALLLAAPATSLAAEPETALFAGGCFWSMEKAFDKVPGVLETTSGYAGGTMPNPTYENHEGYLEAVRVRFDPAVVSYDTLLSAYWHATDPTDAGGQFCDRGASYGTAVFAADDAQAASAEASRAAVAAQLGQTVVTPIRAATTFTAAEDYHQDFHVKNPQRYEWYRVGCGRDRRTEELWGASAHTSADAG